VEAWSGSVLPYIQFGQLGGLENRKTEIAGMEVCDADEIIVSANRAVECVPPCAIPRL
jgi:hypothetical protein